MSDIEMTKVTIELPKRFVDFVEAYTSFFGKETTVEDFMRSAIFDGITTVYNGLEEMKNNTITGIIDEDWLAKFRNISYITAQDGPEDP